MQSLKLGIIGAGFVTRFHARALQQLRNIEIAALTSRTRASAGKMSRGCAKSTPRTSGAMNSLMTCHAVSVVSLL